MKYLVFLFFVFIGDFVNAQRYHFGMPTSESIVINSLDEFIIDWIPSGFWKKHLTIEDKNYLDDIINLTVHNPEFIVVLEVHSGTKGSSKYNQKYTEWVSDSIREYFNLKNTDILVIAKGEGHPLIKDFDSKYLDSINRRMVVKFISKKNSLD